jgi:hypothetical protein
MKIPRKSRADRRRRVFLKSRLKTPRARDLYRSLISRRKDPDALVEAHALKITELVVLAEEARAKAAELLGKVAADKESIAAFTAMVNAVTRAEGTSRRAMVDFEKGAAAAAEPDPDEWGRIQDEADRLAEERRLANLAKRETEQ